MSDTIETEESGLLLISRNKLFNSKIWMMPLLWILMKMQVNWSSWVVVTLNQMMNVSMIILLMSSSVNEQPRPSTLDDQLSGCTSNSEGQLAAVGSSGDFANVVKHKVHLTDHQKLTLLKRHFVSAQYSSL